MNWLCDTTCIWGEHTPHWHNGGWSIWECRLSISTAVKLRYMAKCRHSWMVEVKKVLLRWYVTLVGKSGWMLSSWMWRLQERVIEQEGISIGGGIDKVNSFGRAPHKIGCLQESSGNDLYSLTLEFSTYDCNITFKKYGDRFGSNVHVVWFRIGCGGTAYTSVLVYMSITHRDSQ